jgi:hypothetical protein
MNNQTLLYIAALTIALIIIVYLIYYVYNLQKPGPGSCDVIKDKDPTVLWGAGCQFIQEIKLDNTITTPKIPLTLTKFTSSPSLGPGWGGVCVWYSYRYVNGKTGNYGNLSPWTTTFIQAGLPLSELPVSESTKNSGSFTYSGHDSCNSNLPELYTPSLDYSLSSGIYINVHRFVSSTITPPPEGTIGTIIGLLEPNGKGGGIYLDVSSSPCADGGCSTPKGC